MDEQGKEAASEQAEEENEEEESEESSDEESSSDSSSENSDPEGKLLPAETLLQGRKSRATAGRRMAALLDEEDVSPPPPMSLYTICSCLALVQRLHVAIELSSPTTVVRCLCLCIIPARNAAATHLFCACFSSARNAAVCPRRV